MFSVVTLQLFGALFISLAAALLVLPVVRSLAFRHGWVDHPDGNRKVHRKPIAVVGGVGIVVGTLAGLVYLQSIGNLLPFGSVLPPMPVLIGAVIMFATGLYDDMRGLDFRKKFLLQIVAAYFVVVGGVHIDLSAFGFGVENGSFSEATLSIPITVLWIVGIINAINLVDGLDGLASGLSLIAFSSLALVFAVTGHLGAVAFAIPFIGGLTAFLFHNFNPARIFMGDSGSYFLGFWLATYSLQTPTHSDPVVAVLILVVILGIPLLDTLYAMVRRAIKGDSPFIPDREHIHHRLIRRFSHKVSVLILYGIGACLGLSGVLMTSMDRLTALGIFGGVVGFCFVLTVSLGQASKEPATILKPSVATPLDLAASPASASDQADPQWKESQTRFPVPQH